MTLFIATSRALIFGSLAALSATAVAQDNLSHPTAVCVESRTSGELGADFVDLVLAEMGFAERPVGFEQKLVAIAMECASEHGLPQIDGNLMGRFAAASAMRKEAAARLVAMDMDMAWLETALSERQVSGASDPVAASERLFDQLALASPEGLGIDVRNGSEDDQLLGLLVYTHLSGLVEELQARGLIEG